MIKIPVIIRPDYKFYIEEYDKQMKHKHSRSL